MLTVPVPTFAVFPEKSPTSNFVGAGAGSESGLGSIERTNLVAASSFFDLQ